MRPINVLATWLLASAATGLFWQPAVASVSLTFGAGSAVTSIDRKATFDSVSSGTNLANYTEDMLRITTPGSSLVAFAPFNDGTMTEFYYADGGNHSYVTITGTDAATFSGLELKIGDGYAILTTTTLFTWETYLDGTLTGSGDSLIAAKGSIVGWSDPSGFDELRIGATKPIYAPYHFGDSQAVAIDNVHVQLSDGASGMVPEPRSIAVWCGLVGVALCYWVSSRDKGRHRLKRRPPGFGPLHNPPAVSSTVRFMYGCQLLGGWADPCVAR